MQTLFTSDLHLGHKAICKYRPEFKTSKEHDDYMLDKILSLRKRTVLHILGDFLFDGPHFDEYIERLSKKKCRIKLVFGNHDSLKLLDYRHLFEIQLPLYSYKGHWISHCPIHPQEMRGRLGCVHGHLHKEEVMIEYQEWDNYDECYYVEDDLDKRYFNVNIDVNGYEFVKWEEIKNHFIES